MPSFDEAEEQDEVDVAVGEFGEAEVEEADEEDDEAEDAMKVRSVISMSLAASCSLPGGAIALRRLKVLMTVICSVEQHMTEARSSRVSACQKAQDIKHMLREQGVPVPREADTHGCTRFTTRCSCHGVRSWVCCQARLAAKAQRMPV